MLVKALQDQTKNKVDSRIQTMQLLDDTGGTGTCCQSVSNEINSLSDV